MVRSQRIRNAEKSHLVIPSEAKDHLGTLDSRRKILRFAQDDTGFIRRHPGDSDARGDKSSRLGLTALVALLLVGCNGDPAVEVAGVEVPSVEARVLTVRTRIPETPVIHSAVVVAQGKVRIGTETDRWRLFDLEAGTVTFVDDISRTYRTETHEALLRKRMAVLRQPIPAGLAPAVITKTGGTRTFAGITGEQYLVQMGLYQQELWLSTEPLVAPQFFSMKIASDPLNEDTAPAMRQVNAQLSKMEGFPVFERSELPYGNKQLVIEKTLVRIEQKPVPRSWITIPEDYRDVTATESPGGPQPAS